MGDYEFLSKEQKLKIIEPSFFEETFTLHNITIYPNVHIEKNVEIGIGSIIGYPPLDKSLGELAVNIGENTKILTSAIIYGGNTFGANCFLGHRAYVRECNSFGERCGIGTNSEIEGYSSFGNQVKLHTRVCIGEYSTLKNNIFIAPGTIFTNAKHPPCAKCLEGPTISDYVAVGANVTIAPRVFVGEKSIIGAGAVVVKDVLPRQIVAGVPARPIGTIDNIRCDKGIIKCMPDGIYERFYTASRE